MIKRIIQRFKPKDIDTVSPFHELYDNLKGSFRFAVLCIVICFIAADFISGWIYYLFARIFDRRIRELVITTCFKNGVSKMLLLTILLTLLFCYMVFKVYRSLARNYTKNYADNYLKADQETYGGAHFQTECELKKNFTITKSAEETTNEIFGTKDGKIYAFNYPRGLNHNKVYVGSPGAGKSDAIIKNDLFQAVARGESVILTDTKGDLYAETSAVLREKGIKVKLLNFKPTEFMNSDGWNLFSNLRADDPSLDAQADVIADTIIKNTSSSVKETSNYWGTNEFNLIKFATMYVASDPTYINLKKNTLPEMFNLLSTSNPKTFAGIAANIPKSSPIRQCYDIFANCNEMNQGQIINGAAIRLSKLTNRYLQEVLSHNDIDPILPMQEQCVYYVVMSDTTDAYKFLSSLFFTTMFQSQCDYSDKLNEEKKKEQLVVNYLMDEYKNTGGIQTLPVNIASVRSRKISITIILQDLGQLSSVHGDQDAATILNDCDIKCLLKTGDRITEEYFSFLLGKQTVMIENQKYSEDSADIIHAKNTIQKTLGEGQRPLMLPEELGNGKLSLDELIYVINGMPPIRLNKYFSSGAPDTITGIYKNPPHPMTVRCKELGIRKCCDYKPEWRKADEEAAQQENSQPVILSYNAKENTQKNADTEALREANLTKQTTPAQPVFKDCDKEALFDDLL